MFKQIDYTMVVVSDMERSVEFYRDKLGIPLKFQSPDWTEFQTGTRRWLFMAAEFRRQRLRLAIPRSKPAVARLDLTLKTSTRPTRSYRRKVFAS